MTDFSNIKIAKGFKDIDPYEFADTDAAKTMFAKSRANGGSTAAASEEPSSGKTNGRARVEEPVPPTPEPGNATPLPEYSNGALTLEDFLRCVVPWPSTDEPGFITIHNHLRDQPFLGKSCRSVDEALSTVANLNATTRHNIYFCISRQKLNSGHRDRENALRFCCIPIDIDIKRNSPKHYGTMSEALAALYNFCINHGIPKPSLIVRTGGGLHVYWLSDRVLTVDEWQPYANGLKAAAKAAGLKFDPACTGDAARVLRVPGTLNYKYDPPRPVSLLQGPNLPNGDRHDFAAVFGKLLDKKAAPLQQPKIEIAKGFKDIELTPSGIDYDDTPLPFAPIKEGCAWLREAHDTGGKDHDQPQWHLAVLAATFLENGDELAHQLGNQHSDYAKGEKTEEMWDRKVRERKEKDLGWPSCKAIKDAGSEHCQGCPHFDKGKSPLNLALQQTKAPAATIHIINGEIARVVDEAEDALLAVADAAPIMVRAGMLVQPIVDLLPASEGRKTEVVLLRRLTAANLVYLLNKHAAVFERYDGRAKKWLKVDPTPAIATQLLEKGRRQFPKVAGVINAPTLRPDGTILDAPGYDPATQLWYHPDSQLVLPQLCATPTRERAEQALKLFTDLLTGYPFDNNVDRSVALAAILTPVLRGAFDVVPMNLLRAPDAGSGKSHFVDLASIIARGQLCPVVTNVKSVEEMEKRLGALVLEGAPMASLDNCSCDLGGDLLCQITERRLIRIRILGLSEMPVCEWRGVLYATGNNITFLLDMARRGLTANIDAKVERPELREFSFNPIERVLADRGSYIAAAITIARAYITAGSPKVCGPLGSYTQWSRLVRSPLIWLGQEDPVKSMDEAREEDPVRRAEQDLIMVWRTQLGASVTHTAASLIGKADQHQTAGSLHESGWAHPRLRELLLQQAGTPRGDIDAKKVGNWLTSIRGRVYDGYCVERVKESKGHGSTYTLTKRQGAAPHPTFGRGKNEERQGAEEDDELDQD